MQGNIGLQYNAVMKDIGLSDTLPDRACVRIQVLKHINSLVKVARSNFRVPAGFDNTEVPGMFPTIDWSRAQTVVAEDIVIRKWDVSTACDLCCGE